MIAVMTQQTASWDLVLRMDYGQFSLEGSYDDEDNDRLEEYEPTLEQAMAGDGIARVSNRVVIISPHQNNFAMQVTVETWAGVPTDDLDEWQEAFEVSLDIDEEGLIYESPTLARKTVSLTPGRYGIRISGRGFVSHGWPGGTEPGDQWRWQLWLSDHDIEARRLRSW